MNKPINETTVREWFLNKQKEINAMYVDREEHYCIYCGEVIEGTELVHSTCAEDYNKAVDKYKGRLPFQCNCGYVIHSPNYRCPICYNNANPINVDINTDTINSNVQGFKDINRRAVINNVKADFTKTFSNIFTDDVEEESDTNKNKYNETDKNRLQRDINNAKQKMDDCVKKCEENKTDMNNDIRNIKSSTSNAFKSSCILTIVGGYIIYKCIKASPEYHDLFTKLISKFPFSLIGVLTLALASVGFMTVIANMTERTNCIDKYTKANRDLENDYNEAKATVETKERELAKVKHYLEDELPTKINERKVTFEFVMNLMNNLKTDNVSISVIQEYGDNVRELFKNIKKAYNTTPLIIEDKVYDYINNAITIDALETEIRTCLNYIPKIELDRFINYIKNTPTHFITEDNILNPLRYYIRFIDVINGTKSPNESKAVRKFQNAFFNNLNMAELVNNEKLAIRKLKATIPAEIEFKGTNEYENGYTAEPAEHYVINTMMDTYCNAYYNNEYDKNDLNEFFNYMYIVIADYIATIEQLEIERIETKERIKETRRLQEIEDQREHELEVAEINARAMRYQADTESAIARQYEAEARQREADNDRRLQTMINENNALRKDLNNSNNAINSMAKDINELKKKSNESVFNSPNKRLEIWKAGQIFRGEDK